MPITYDGRNIYRKNNVDYNAYNDYMQAQKKRGDEAVKKQVKKQREVSWEQWMQWCPQDFRDASIESIGEHDPQVEEKLNKAVAASVRRNVPYSIILGSAQKENPNYVKGSNKPGESRYYIPKGKTWAMYAYVSALYEAGVIIDPIHEVKIITEAELLDKLTTWNERDMNKWLASIFDKDVKLIIIDNINGGAGSMKRTKNGMDAWNRFLDESVKHDGIGYVLSFSGNIKDASLIKLKEIAYDMVKKRAAVAVLENGVEGMY